MKIRVLGSGAGGGFPQWNCNCRLCSGVRQGTVRTSTRTQSSISIAGESSSAAAMQQPTKTHTEAAHKEQWLLVNASPDILQQLRSFPELQPAIYSRDTAIVGVLLIDAQIDHTTGLCMLREHNRPHEIWSTASVRDDLSTGFPLFKLLDHYSKMNWHEIPLQKSFTIPNLAAVRLTAYAVTSNAPPYSPHRNDPQVGDNIGLMIENEISRKKCFYSPGLGQMEPHIWQAMQESDCVLVDGTLWTDDEMIRLGFSQHTARDMGHMPLIGSEGMLSWLAKLKSTTRKILIHINNTNPILDEDSAERQILNQMQIEVAYDEMEIVL